MINCITSSKWSVLRRRDKRWRTWTICEQRRNPHLQDSSILHDDSTKLRSCHPWFLPQSSSALPMSDSRAPPCHALET
ncbi:hypothetical protein LINGRAHAP2_LOCUS25460 [Linum grandiflorum]